ncbi:complement C3-like [Denticeps clupeoides]|uniref:complement C3-like n=1 Tax=Denticeps clupeoides TaxID=299321 RepID=UPI0010A3EE06|nr:complement C3-like [Denticeps clupeoides]
MCVDLVWPSASLLLSLLPALSLCEPLYVMSAPSLLKVGGRERVFVEAQDHAGAAFDVQVTVKSHPDKKRDLLTETVSLSEANHHQALLDVKIPYESFADGTRRDTLVYLQAQFPGRLLEKVVLVNFQSGYVFVQTDKPIYTPSSAVRYRVFTLTPDLQPEENAVSVQIMSPDGVVIQADRLGPGDGYKSGSFKLPDLVSFGVWKIMTWFTTASHVNFTSEFEVKEYVLPSFEITLRPTQPFFYVDDSELTVNIEAKYLYGKEVTGVAFVVFGVMTNDRDKRSLPGSLQRVEVMDGKGKVTLKRSHITQVFPSITDLVDSSLYVSVTVSTETGSEMVEAVKRGIAIVTSPYTIRFKRTPKYFKPGMPFDVLVLVVNPDNSPAKDIIVEISPGSVRGRTEESGLARVTINTPAGISTLRVTVMTRDPRLSEARQGRQTMTANAYRPSRGSRNYLHIGVNAAELTIGDHLKVNLNLGDSPGVRRQDFTYLVMNRGLIVRAERFKREGQSLVTLSLPVTKDMVPSFRIIAYYHVGSSEVVSDSVWVDVKDTCLGTLRLALDSPRPMYNPGTPITMSITGEPGAKVGLVAVDKGVYVLNNKHRLTQTKIWDVVESLDPGCTAGSGKDSMAVFYDAGLVFASSTAGGTDTRRVHSCPSPTKRRKRDITIQEVHRALASRFADDLRQCCVDGMKDVPQAYTCDRRAEYIVDGPDCVSAFLHCCKELAAKKKETRVVELIHSRSEEKDDDFVSSEDIVSRTEFPESWLWVDEVLPVCPSHNRNCDTTSITKRSFLQDSITTWKITAISLSTTSGICVADPLDIVVMKYFFVDLKLPYSAVRNEQIEVKALLHNYNDFAIKVGVELAESDNVCSLATRRGRYRVTVDMDAMSSRAVPFVIVPLALGRLSVEVKAAVRRSSQTDGVKKTLRVVAEGVPARVDVKKLVLDPSKHGGVQREEVMGVELEDRAPDTPMSTYVTVLGNEMSLTVEKALRGDTLSSLIVEPGGCAEQNMNSMIFPVIATHYLDRTGQWDSVGGSQARARALGHVIKGYNRQLSFRKADGSFGSFGRSTRGTWLTAKAAKVFAIASNYVYIDPNVVCSAQAWLVRNGVFRDAAPVYHGDMLHSLPAYVLIAMQEGSGLCRHVAGLADTISRVIVHLEGRVSSMRDPYQISMVSYALANAGRLNKDVLLRCASADHSHWPVKTNPYFTLEATAYALLALVKVKDFEAAGPLVSWLNAQRSSSGAFGSSESTLIVFQALAEYQMHATGLQDLNMEVTVSEPGRDIKWLFNKDNQLVPKSERMRHANDRIVVTAKGRGQGSLSVLTMYYAMPKEKDSDCSDFALEVSVEKDHRVSYGSALETYRLIIDVMYLSKSRDATMSILDISLLTGFVVDETDLAALTTGKDRYIQKFEMDKQLSDRGSLIIYLNKVSHQRPDRLVFRMHKILLVGVLQPVGVTIYEYYSEKRCVKFYHPHKMDGALRKICDGGVCECAEENCSLQKKEKIGDSQRVRIACERGRDYVYKATVERIHLNAVRDVYYMRINSSLRWDADEDVVDQLRAFISYPQCRDALELKQGKSYLVMGQSADISRVAGRYEYLVGFDTWIEYWPTEEEGRTDAFRVRYKGIAYLEQELAYGC